MEKTNTHVPAPQVVVTEHIWDETKGFVDWIWVPGDSDSGGVWTSELSVLIKHRGFGFYPLAKPDPLINGMG